MNTHSRAEQVALHGLLLLVVEVQNAVRGDLDYRPHKLYEHISQHAIETVEALENIVDSAHARELIQLARAALETRADSGNAHNHGNKLP